MDKVRVIERSLRCFRYGLLSLIPFLGLGFALLTFYRWRQVAKEVRKEWNPAKAHLRWGVAIAICGILISAALITIIIFAIFYENSYRSNIL